MTNEPAQHDAIYKRFFGEPEMVRSLIEDFLPPALAAELDFSTLERLPAEHVSETLQKRAGDLVWRVRRQDGSPCYVAILLEFQSAPDRFMALRILNYVGLLLEALAKTEEVAGSGLPPVLPIVIYNGTRPWNAAEDVADLFAAMSPLLRMFCPRLRYFLLNVRAVPASALRDKGIAAQLVRLEQAEDVEGVREIVRDMLVRFQGPEYTRLRRQFVVWLKWEVLRRNDAEQNLEEVNELDEVEAMLGHNMDKWQEKYIQIGKSQGITLGREEGREQGISLGREQMLFSLVGEGLLPLGTAAAKANMSEEEFRERMERERGKE